jgi:glutathione peroxidase
MGIITALYGGVTAAGSSAESRVYPLVVKSGRGSEVDLAQYRGKVLLIVNTASKCGFTRQYDGLEALYQRYNQEGLEVLGFPSNDFAGQEPESDSDIQEFCRINHGVTFPLFAKGPVKGEGAQPLFKLLTERGPRDLRGAVRWNFEKFLVDREGNLIGRWCPYVTPQSASLNRAIRKALSPLKPLQGL